MRPAIPNRVALQFRVNATLHEKLKAIADRENRALNSQIEYYCKKGVEQYERENGKVEIEEHKE